MSLVIMDWRRRKNNNLDKTRNEAPIFERIIRDRDECAEISFSNELIFATHRMCITSPFYFRQSTIDQFLSPTPRGREKIHELTANIKAEDRIEETEKYTIEMCGMIQTDPRLSDELQHDFLKHLVKLLEYEQNPMLQSHVAIILQLVIAYSSNGQVVIDNVTESIILNLLRSKVCEVRIQALWLLHTIAIKFSTFPEAALEPLTYFLTDDKEVDEVLCVGGRTLAVACQINPKLPCDKLKSVLRALMKLITYESFTFMKPYFKHRTSDFFPAGCAGLVYLCEGREEMVVENEYFKPLIKQLTRLICDTYVRCTAGLEALGSIVRWGSDDDIEVIINEGLWWLKWLLRKQDKFYVKNACWIISNITARKENHIKAVIDSELIDPLVRVIENHESLDVKKEAAWAISNVIYGVGPDQIEDLRSRCVKPFWNLLKECGDNQELVSFCSEALVKLKGIKITCNDQPIDGVEWFKVSGQTTNDTILTS